MNRYYVLGLLVIIFFSFVYTARIIESTAEIKIQNQKPLTKVKTVKQEQLPIGIILDEFGDLVATKDYKGIYIRLSQIENISRVDAKLVIEGIVGIFVNEGAAMAVWQEFPKDVIFYVKDLSTGKTYESIYLERSVSWDVIPEFGPSNQIVQNLFEKNLFNTHFFHGVERISDELKPGTSIEVYVTFKGMTSNTLTVTVE